jgi:hypothetical protein
MMCITEIQGEELDVILERLVRVDLAEMKGRKELAKQRSV